MPRSDRLSREEIKIRDAKRNKEAILVRMSEFKDGYPFRIREIAAGWDIEYKEARQYVEEMYQQGLINFDRRYESCTINDKGRALVKKGGNLF